MSGLVKMAFLYNVGEDGEQNVVFVTFEERMSGSWTIQDNKLIHTFQDVDISEPEFSALGEVDAEWANAIRDYVCSGEFRNEIMEMKPDEIIQLTDSVLQYKNDGEVFTSTKVR